MGHRETAYEDTLRGTLIYLLIQDTWIIISVLLDAFRGPCSYRLYMHVILCRRAKCIFRMRPPSYYTGRRAHPALRPSHIRGNCITLIGI